MWQLGCRSSIGLELIEGIVQFVEGKPVVSVCYRIVKTEGVITLIEVRADIFTRVEDSSAIIFQILLAKTGVDQIVRIFGQFQWIVL
jgi:hypothetical protein